MLHLTPLLWLCVLPTINYTIAVCRFKIYEGWSKITWTLAVKLTFFNVADKNTFCWIHRETFHYKRQVVFVWYCSIIGSQYIQLETNLKSNIWKMSKRTVFNLNLNVKIVLFHGRNCTSWVQKLIHIQKIPKTILHTAYRLFA